MSLTRTLMPTLVAAATLAGLANAAPGDGQPGEALLVPYVLCDTTPTATGAPGINTGISITTAGMRSIEVFDSGTMDTTGNLLDSANRGELGDGSSFNPGSPPRLHWSFYDTDGNRVLGAKFDVSRNDVALLDWCRTIEVFSLQPYLDRRSGYLVITDAAADRNQGAGFAIWGKATLFDNWAGAAADLPVLPLADGGSPVLDPQGDTRNEVLYAGREPVRVVPWSSAVKMNNRDGDSGDEIDATIPYVLPSFGIVANEWVFWFDRACTGGDCDRTAVSTDVYDNTGQFRASTQLDLGRALNILRFDAGDQDGSEAGNDPWLPGMAHSVGSIDNTGTAKLAIPETSGGSSADTYAGGLFFNLLFYSL